ncbi:DUF2628 domain-containing protein [Pararhizobium haloflavum]|uniref:DUF2628 domain-containing protein n=1 Tax=Pararhizobium haloflavum TaxID=2037914 RepID=UPI000C185D24|nr:DUF2628 domain-containing protein [Pararhizobium haloflavum]
MASYVVLKPPGGDPAGEDAVFIRDGFAFLALVLPIVWFLWHRLWLWALVFIALAIATSMMMMTDDWYAAGFALSVATSLLAALEGQNLRIGKHLSKGWEQVAVIAADDVGTAEAVYFAGHESYAPAVQASPPAARPSEAPRTRRKPGTYGLFEWNGER